MMMRYYFVFGCADAAAARDASSRRLTIVLLGSSAVSCHVAAG